MMRFIMPVILIGIGITVFFMFSNPLYNNIKELRTQVASYDEALNNSKALESERDKLTAKNNAFDVEDLVRLKKLLPENIDNIRLILEIEQIALPYGMVLKDIKYNVNDTAKSPTATATGTVAPVIQGGGTAQIANKEYGVWDLEFSTTGSYNNFLNFTKDLEKNLRIVDISSITFSSNASVSGVPNLTLPEAYKYSFRIKTYWLKN